MSLSAPTFGESAQDSFLIPLFKPNLHQWVNFLKKAHSLNESEIAKRAFMNRGRLLGLLSSGKGAPQWILTDEVMALFNIHKNGNDESGDRSHLELVESKSEIKHSDLLPENKIHLNGKNLDFRQYIKLLQDEVSPGIPYKKIAEFAGITYNRFRSLLALGNMSAEEARSFQQLYFKLKSGEISYIPIVQQVWPKELGVPKLSPEYEELKNGHLVQYIDYLRVMRPGLEDEEIAESANIMPARFISLLKGANIGAEEVRALRQVPFKLGIDEIRN